MTVSIPSVLLVAGLLTYAVGIVGLTVMASSDRRYPVSMALYGIFVLVAGTLMTAAGIVGTVNA